MNQESSAYPIHFVVNPKAGGGRHRKRLPGVLAALRAHGIHGEVTETAAPGHATELVRALGDQARLFIAVGGDGTVNEIVNGLSHPDSIVGVLPSGTGNDFARLVGVTTPERAAEAIRHGRIESFDLVVLRIVEGDGRTLEHSFINIMGVGFDAAVAVRVSQGSIGRGIVPYLVAVLSTLRRFHAVPATIEWNAQTLRTDLFLATLGNGTTSGGGFMLVPDARPDDGLLDLCLVGAVRTLRVLRILPKTFRGGHVHEKEVRLARSPSFIIALDSPLPVHADGEIVTLQAVRIEASVRPGAVRVLTLRDHA